MKKVIILALAIVSVAITAKESKAQARFGGPELCHEIGLGAGISHYFGDLTNDGNNKFPYFDQFGGSTINPAGALFYRMTIGHRFAVRANALFTRIEGGERSYDGAEVNIVRPLHFRSNLFELALIGELNILEYCPGDMAHRFTPYVFGGVAGIYHNPKAIYNDEFVALQPLGTEGQGLAQYPEREKYSRVQPVIPVGLGVKFNASERISLGLELGHRFTFTDYLDDISTTYVDPAAIDMAYAPERAAMTNELSMRREITDPVGDFVPGAVRGDDDGNDNFFVGMVTISYAFGMGRNNMGCYSGRNKDASRMKCAAMK